MKRPNDMRPTSTVERITKLDITGNMIPPTWYQTIIMPNGKPDFYAICILADFVYWHKAKQVFDPKTRKFIGWQRKFYEDKFHENYRTIAKKFNMTINMTRDAIYRLIELGVLIRELRTIVSKEGIKLSNVPYWDIDVDVLIALTYPEQFPIGEEAAADAVDIAEMDDDDTETNDGYLAEKCIPSGLAGLEGVVQQGYTNTKTSYETSLTALTSNEVKVSQAQPSTNGTHQKSAGETGTLVSPSFFDEPTFNECAKAVNGKGQSGTNNSSARKTKKESDPDKVAMDWLWIERLAEILGMDSKINAGRLGRTRNTLRTSGYTLEDLEIYQREVWPSSWKAKNESHPKENDLREGILEARKIRERRTVRVEQTVKPDGMFTIVDPFGDEIMIDSKTGLVVS